MSDKKPYTPPQVFRVELNHEQAILSACSLMAMNTMAGGSNMGCVMTGCKMGGTAGRDSAARPS